MEEDEELPSTEMMKLIDKLCEAAAVAEIMIAINDALQGKGEK